MIELLATTGLGPCLAIMLAVAAIITAAMRGRRQ